MILNLDKYIRELLLQHDCVILPGLGGFVANYKPATFDASQRIALPPSRQILFNPNLIHNDGLLYAHISKETNYGYKEVQSMAEVYFKTIFYKVRKGLKFTIEDLGYFFLNKSREIEFAQETTDNLLLASYGLSYLNYKEFSKMPGKGEHVYRAIDESHPVVRQRRIRRWVYTGAAACLVAAMILVPVKMGYLNLSRFNLNPVDSFRREQPVREMATSSPDTDSQLAGDDKTSGMPETRSTGPETEPAGPGPELTSPTIDPVVSETQPGQPGTEPVIAGKSYHVIVGSFRDFGNAQQLKQQMAGEGYDAEILPGENSFFRVSASHFPRKPDAMAALSGIRSQQAYKSAWILAQ